MKLKELWHREDGSVIIVAAVAFILITIVCGIVIDVGAVYMKSSSSQNAADAAAFAASTILPAEVGNAAQIQQVKDVASAYAAKNGFDAGSIQGVELDDIFNGKYYGVRVRLTNEVPYSFGPIVGLNGTTVTKSAKVSLEPVTSSESVVPLGIESSKLSEALSATEGTDLIIKYDGGGGSEGFYGALDLDGVQGGGAKDFESWLAFGYDGILRMGDNLPTESGNMAGPTTDAFWTRYNQCTHYAGQGGCNEINFVVGCPRIVTIIVYTFIDGNTVRVEGFVPFVLKGLNGNGEIVASKITVRTSEGETDGVLGGIGDYGIYRLKLVE